MKLLPSLVLTAGLLLASGCESSSEPRVGMAEKIWLRHTVLADEVYTEGSVKAYRSNRMYYYFRDGILVKIDQRRFSAQAIEDLNKTAPMSAPSDVYAELKKLDELRKDGILSDEEFQAQKKKILDRK
ncbi:MAG TPA: SHOCT domain-containing protein [Lacunisphaera sp.]|nr:SHOCT domain-containing protein [Lacunisphaera sp.]